MRVMNLWVRVSTALCLAAAFWAVHGAPGDEPSRDKKAMAARNYAKLPMHFEANKGQFPNGIRFGTRGRGYQLYLSGTEMVVTLENPSPEAASATRDRKSLLKSKHERQRERVRGKRPKSTVLKKTFLNANRNPQVVGEGMLPGKSHYFIGKNPARWRKDVPHYARVRYRNVYPGIDLVYYGTGGRLEYDWVVAPGTDPHRIIEAFQGATGLQISDNGDLVVQTKAGSVRQRKPVIYQDIAGKRVPVEGAYVVVGDKRVGFQVGQYDRSQPLVIDPVLEYSTFLGGLLADNAMSIAVNASGEAYVTGDTISPDFPHGPTDEFPGRAAFVTKLNAAGDGLVYSTYFGGPVGFNGGSDIALGSDGSAYVGGMTSSPDFPATVVIGQAPSSSDPIPTQVAFAVKLAPAGNALTYSTLIGGSNDGATWTTGIEVDAAGSAFLAGDTNGSFFPTTPGALQTELLEQGAGFVVKLNAAGNAPVYSTLFGGSALLGLGALGIDSSGHAYIAGTVLSSSLPVVNAYQPENGGDQDGFFAKLDPSGSSLIYSSYLGGAGVDQLYGIAVDAQGNAYLTGLSDGCCFPFVNPLMNPPQDGGFYAIVAKVNAAGSVAFATPLGGSWSSGSAIAVDRLGSIYVTGSTFNDTGFPEVGDIGLGSDPALNVPRDPALDAFVAKIANDGSSFAFSFRIGGNGFRPGDPRYDNNDFVQNGPDEGRGIAVDTAGGVYIVGHTRAEDFPTLQALQPGLAAYNGGDAFVVKLFEAAGDVGLFSTKNPSIAGEPVTFTAIVPDATVTGTVTFLDGALTLGTTPVSSGVAKLTTSSLSAATHAITARYDGDATHPVATSAVLIQDVLDANAQPAPTSIVLDGAGNPNGSVTLTAVVSGVNPTGIVAFIVDNSQQQIGVLSGGTASITLNQPAAGTHSVTASYSGDVRNAPSLSAPFSFLVGPPVANFSAPANDAAFALGAVVEITADAQAQISASITSVDVSLNGAPLATLTTPPYTFALSTAPPGVHTLGVQATDNLGQTSALFTQRLRVFEPGVTFFHQDLQGNVVLTTNGVGQVVYTENYQPYGARLVANPASRVGEQDGNRLWFHGKAQDESTGLQYFGARYYDPVLGRFMGVDPILFEESNIQSFNRYLYANNNPYRFVDPDGRKCISINGWTTCDTGVSAGLPIVTFPTPAGFPSAIEGTELTHHFYDKPVSAGPDSAALAPAIRRTVINDPTPGKDMPASEAGTPNNARPDNGWRRFVSIDSPVLSYTRTDSNGNLVVVNVTQPGHPLHPGIVVRGVVVQNGQSVIRNVGEGTGWPQGFGPLSDRLINDVWIRQSEQNIQDAR